MLTGLKTVKITHIVTVVFVYKVCGWYVYCQSEKDGCIITSGDRIFLLSHISHLAVTVLIILLGHLKYRGNVKLHLVKYR